MGIQTLPAGYAWLDEAFERYWSSTEDAAALLEALNRRPPNPDFAAAMGGGNWDRTDPAAQAAYDQSRRQAEARMRAALSDGRLRAFITHPINGQTTELTDRHKWAELSLGVANFDRQPHRLTCPGPDSGGAHVYVLLRELTMLERTVHGSEPTKPKLATVRATEAHWQAFKAQFETWPTMEKAEAWRKANIPHVTRTSWREKLRAKGFDTKPGPKGPRRPVAE